MIYFEQKDESDQDILSLLCKCFKLFYMEGQRSRGLHRNSLRRVSHENYVYSRIGLSSSQFLHAEISSESSVMIIVASV